MPRVLDRYLFREAFWLFWAGLFTFVFVLISSRVIFDVFRYLYELNLARNIVWQLFYNQLPRLALDAAPGALLFAIFLSGGRLSREMETPAIFWAGVHPTRTLLPYLVLALLLTAGTMQWREKVAITGQEAYLKLKKTHVDRTGDERLLLDVAFRLDPQRMLYARRLDTHTGDLRHVMILHQQDGGVDGFLTAPSATWEEGDLTLHQGATGNREAYTYSQTLQEEDQVLHVGRHYSALLSTTRSPDSLTLPELREQIRYKVQSGLEHRELLTEYFMRFSFPFSCVVIVLITVPLAYRLGRQENMVNAVLSVFFVSFYWGLMAVARGIANKGALEPFLGEFTIPLLAWSQNVIILILGGTVLLVHRAFTR